VTAETAEAAENFYAPDPYVCHIDADAAYAFGRATNDGNERYVNGEAVPPMFTAQFALGAQTFGRRPATPQPDIVGAPHSVHGEHDVTFHGPVLPGMTLRIEAGLFGAQQTKGGVLSTQRYTFSDEHGVPLVEHLWGNFHIGGTISPDVGTPMPDHTFPESTRAHPVGSSTVTVDRDQQYRFAGVSNDHAPHATTEAAAHREGYPAKILQGMCTFALASAVLVDLLADGDPHRLRRLAGRFSAPAMAARDFVVHAYDAGVTPDGRRSFAFEAIQDGVVVLKHGRVELT
jgi:acyl dehydratase